MLHGCVPDFGVAKIQSHIPSESGEHRDPGMMD